MCTDFNSPVDEIVRELKEHSDALRRIENEKLIEADWLANHLSSDHGVRKDHEKRVGYP